MRPTHGEFEEGGPRGWIIPWPLTTYGQPPSQQLLVPTGHGGKLCFATLMYGDFGDGCMKLGPTLKLQGDDEIDEAPLVYLKLLRAFYLRFYKLSPLFAEAFPHLGKTVPRLDRYPSKRLRIPSIFLHYATCFLCWVLKFLTLLMGP